MIKFNRKDLDFALSNHSVDMTLLALFIAIKSYYPNDVELVRNIVTDIINCYMNQPSIYFVTSEINGTIQVHLGELI